VGVVIAAPVPTPDLAGRDSASARMVLAQQQLRLGSLRVRDADADPGTVIDQDPPPGMLVPLGTVVNVAIASGTRVPDLVGMDSAAAVQALGRSRLSLGRVLHERSSAEVGSLIRQDVSPGSVVRPGTRVAVVVADGVSVPDVRGMRIGPVRDSLESHQLTLGSITETPSEAPTGTVIEQAPGPGAVVPLRRDVNVTLALGVPVAGVVGRSTPEARQILADRDLQVGDITQEESTQPPGTVLRQAPDSGTSVPLRTPVDLVVAQGVPVPDLAGADSLGARTALEDARLSLGHLELRPSTEPVGSIIEQNPAPGDVVALAAPVDVVVAQGVIVPDIRQRPSVSADSLVSSLGLGLVERGRRWSLSPAGAVLEQDPAPGVEVPLQTPVAVVVARHIPVGWIAAGLLLLVGAPLALARVRRKGERRKKRPTGSEARIELRPHRDAGSRAFRAGKPPRVALELRWRAVGELGHPAAGTPETLIRGERTRPPPSSEEGEHE
jgi:beta-lactam-binding protein with PASTA domain